jgi:hypothetical protein
MKDECPGGREASPLAVKQEVVRDGVMKLGSYGAMRLMNNE